MTSSPDEPDIEWPPNFPDEKRAELTKIVRAFDSAATEFEKDPTSIYPSEGERERRFHASKRRWAKDWATAGPCMHPACVKRSIARSHSIPMSASIKRTAENGHVVTPRFTSNGLEIVSVGVREASTFPGFCDEHEQQFSGFESTKELTTERHFTLQAFRTLCREIFRMRHYKEKLKTELDAYCKLRNEFIATRTRQASPAKPIDVGNIKFENDRVESRTAEAIQDLSDDIRTLEQFYGEMSDDIKNDTNNARMSFTIARLDLQLPVSLSGMGILNYIEGEAQKRALCLLAIIPEAGQTKIMYGSANEHINALQTLFADRSSPAVIEMLESWMCHGSDHWFMTPSEWARISDSRKLATLDLILNGGLSIADPVEFSILDGARRTIIGIIEKSLAEGAMPDDSLAEVRVLLESERKKLEEVSMPGVSQVRGAARRIAATWKG